MFLFLFFYCFLVNLNLCSSVKCCVQKWINRREMLKRQVSSEPKYGVQVKEND